MKNYCGQESFRRNGVAIIVNKRVQNAVLGGNLKNNRIISARFPFQTAQGYRLSCRDQEGRRGSEEAVPGPSVFPSGDPGVSGDFWGSQEGSQGRFRPSGQNRGLPLRRRCGQGPHLV